MDTESLRGMGDQRKKKLWKFQGWGEYCEAPWNEKSLGIGCQTGKTLCGGGYGYFLEPHIWLTINWFSTLTDTWKIHHHLYIIEWSSKSPLIDTWLIEWYTSTSLVDIAPTNRISGLKSPHGLNEDEWVLSNRLSTYTWLIFNEYQSKVQRCLAARSLLQTYTM